MDRSTVTFTQMGGEGVPWVGQQPFSTDQHMFANLGDGTYFHSGCWPSARASRRGEHHLQDPLQRRGGHDRRPAGRRAARGPLGAADRAELRAEGAAKMVIVTDEPEKYDGVPLPEGVDGAPPRRAGRVQRELREIKGCTVIIYDQTCATEKRRRRKRGTLVDPAKRVVINELVCEGCGDCGVQSPTA
jgi:indolepyruvate ferredoxin oxidoreductase